MSPQFPPAISCTPLVLLFTDGAAGADNASQLQPPASLHPSASTCNHPETRPTCNLPRCRWTPACTEAQWRMRGRQLRQVWAECFCAPLCAEGLHIPHVPAPRGAAPSAASVTGACHHHFPAAQWRGATLLDDGKLQLALSCCCTTLDPSTVMQMETGSGPLYAASSAIPKVGSVQLLLLILSATNGTVSAW